EKKHGAGGCAVIDGGFATQLEKHGAVIDDPLLERRPFGVLGGRDKYFGFFVLPGL
ncbi:Homocysteine S-methyltransferase 1, partial [Cucurbita argyrosperma subsp. argyrosperma]